MTLSAIGSSMMTTNRRVTIPPKVMAALKMEEGAIVNFYKDEYGRIIVQKATTESILSTMELPSPRANVQKVFP